MARPYRSFLVVGSFLVAAVALVSYVRSESPEESHVSFDPTIWFAPQWEDLLGGDAPSPDASDPDLIRLSSATDLQPRDMPAVSKLMVDLAHSSATGEGRDVFGPYFARNHARMKSPSLPSGEFCTEVSIRAVSSFHLPAGSQGGYLKSLVVWQGTCPYPPPALLRADGSDLFVNFLYAARSELLPYKSSPAIIEKYGGWAPIRPVEIPGSTVTTSPLASLPAPWEVRELSACAVPGVKARIEVATAFEALCSSANGLGLLATDGLRTPQEQAERFEDARQRYGSDRAARSRVAYSDGGLCESLHCAGEALDIAPDEGVLRWLTSPSGCMDGPKVSPPPCASGSTPVSRLERFGFVAPQPDHPYHIEFALGTLDDDAEIYGDCTPGGIPVRERVAAVFLCRIMESGFGGSTPGTVLSEALAVAECTSGLDPGFLAHGGRFANVPSPRTGFPDTRSGVFGLSEEVARRWIPAPFSAFTATANIDAAARIYVEERSWGRWGWGPFACAAADDGFITKSVLLD